MAVPGYQLLMLPLLKMTADGKEHSLAEAVDHLAKEFQLSDAERAERTGSGSNRIYTRVSWASNDLRKAGLLEKLAPGRFRLTDRGQELLSTNPTGITFAFLQTTFPGGFPKAGSAQLDESPANFDRSRDEWTMRPDVAERIRRKLEQSIPDEGVRRSALELLAFAIENAEEERAEGWYVRETARGIALMAGRLLTCKVARSRIRLSVIGPISDEVRAAIGAEPQDDEDFKWVPGGVLLTFPVEHAQDALSLLRDGLNSFVDLSMARVRRAVSLSDHVPEAVAYVASVTGRELPQPVPDAEEAEEDSDDVEGDEDSAVAREPRIRARAPIFEHGQRSTASLVSDIEREVIALPDLQRPFVWEDTKVRDLFDSLFLGFPVGTLVLWHTSTDKEARALGAERPGLRATTLIIDGQQRLTSLFAVMRGVDVVGEDGCKRKITLAFRPRDGRFEVADAAIRRDPEFLANVTELWKGPRSKRQIRTDLMQGLRDKGRIVDDKYEDAVEHNLEGAHSIGDYRFPTVDIRKTVSTKEQEATEEDVAEIFVRINNQGMRLGQADFVLTLLSVFHGKLRDRIEERAREMSHDSVIALDTQQLLRAACAVAFGRARMSALYRSLRGVDPDTGEIDKAGRADQLNRLDEAVAQCVELTPWRDYLLRVRHAGFINEGLIASKGAVVNAYALYVRGKRAGVPKGELEASISRWVFATLLTARYSGSSETMFEKDLARIVRATAGEPNGFVQLLDDVMGETITGDYWTRTLVAALETQKSKAPAALAFRAAQIVLGARALFSDQLLRNLVDPPAPGGRTAREAHHLFPEAWLYKRNIRERRVINQVANLADVGWHENNVIGGRGPAEYVPDIRRRLDISDDAWGRMCAEHALPLGWEVMDYATFLVERRRRMSEVIRAAFRKLGGEADAAPLSPPWFVAGTEVVWNRIADTERALRMAVREVYSATFADQAATRIEASLPPQERDSLARALRARPAGADPLSIVDYLYLGQLPKLLFDRDVSPQVTERFGSNIRGRLDSAMQQIAPVRNEIAHVREVAQDRLMRATLACNDVLAVLKVNPAG